MRTLIFSSKEEAEPIRKLLGGEIFTERSSTDVAKYVHDNEDAVAIIVDDELTMGWCTYEPASVVFSTNYSKDERRRIQARGRVRYAPRLKDWGGD